MTAPTRRPRGAGAVRQLPSGRWQARLDGRAAAVTFDTQRDAEAWLQAETAADRVGLPGPRTTYRKCASCGVRYESSDMFGHWCGGCMIELTKRLGHPAPDDAHAFTCDRCDARRWTRQGIAPSLCVDCVSVPRRWHATTVCCPKCTGRFRRRHTRAELYCEDCASRARSAAMRTARSLGTHTPEEWAARLAEYDGCCAYCPAPAASKDHVIAISRGGSDLIENIVPACVSCNSAKGTRTAAVFLAQRSSSS